MSYFIQGWKRRNYGMWDMWFRMNKKQEEQLNLAIAETWIAVLKANPELIKTLCDITYYRCKKEWNAVNVIR